MEMTKEQHVSILNEVKSVFGKQEWFRDATIYNSHPITGEPTLELKVNYVPIFERKNVIDFALKKNLTYYFTQVDGKGNPVQ